MFSKRSVFILGAGASKPYQFPIGSGLVNKILHGNHKNQTELLVKFGFPPAIFSSLNIALKESAASSIDAFLEHREEYIEIGKLLIAYNLIKLEIENNLYHPENDDHWYEYFFHQISKHGFDNLADGDITMITYNYDRSLEHFFTNALKQQKRIGYDEALEELQSKIKIIHLHGKLGELNRMERPYNNSVTDLGKVELAAKGIKIVSEKIDINEDAEFILANDRIDQADRIIFMGFGYYKENIERLALNAFNEKRKRATIGGTAFDLTPSEVNHRIRLAFNFNPEKFYDLRCLAYLRNNNQLFE